MVEVGRLSFALDYQGFRRDLQRMTRDLDRFQKEARQAQRSVGGIGVGAAGGGRYGTPGAGATGARGMSGLAVGGLGAGAARGMGLGTLGMVGAGAAGVGALRGILRVSADLELQLAQVQAVTGATADEFAALESAARSAGASTQFTAAESASGLLELARAGLSVEEATTALRPSLDLATAGLLELGQSADLVTNVAAQFQLPADQIRQIGDVLVGTANRSNTTVAELGQGMKDVGVVASSMGISLNDTSAALGVLANFGLKGSNAAIKLRQSFLQLLDPSTSAKETLSSLGLTVEDVDIRARGLEQVLRTLENRDLDIGSATSLVGTRNAAALVALTRNVEQNFVQMARSLSDVDGEMRNVASSIENTASGKLKQLNSAVQELGLAIGESGVTENFKELVVALTELTRDASGGISSVRDAFRDLRDMSPEVAAGIQAMLVPLSGLVGLAKTLGYGETRTFMKGGGGGGPTPPGMTPGQPGGMPAAIAAFRRGWDSYDGSMWRMPRLAQPWNMGVGSAPAGFDIGPAAPRFAFPTSSGYGQAGPTPEKPMQGPPGLTWEEQERGNRIGDTHTMLEREAKGLRMSRLEREKYYAVLASGADEESAAADRIRRTVEEIQRLERMDVLSEGIGQGIADIGAAWLFAADNAEEATRRILESISQLAVQQFALQPIADAISGIAGSVLKDGFGSTSSNPRTQ